MSKFKITNLKSLKNYLFVVLPRHLAHRYITLGRMIQQHNNINKILIVNFWITGSIKEVLNHEIET